MNFKKYNFTDVDNASIVIIHIAIIFSYEIWSIWFLYYSDNELSVNYQSITDKILQYYRYRVKRDVREKKIYSRNTMTVNNLLNIIFFSMLVTEFYFNFIFTHCQI